MNKIGDNTFPKLLLQHAAQRGNRPAIREKDLGIWQTCTWSQPKMILLDEPSKGLAPQVVDEFFSIVKNLHQQEKPPSYWPSKIPTSPCVTLNGLRLHPGNGQVVMDCPRTRQQRGRQRVLLGLVGARTQELS